MNIIFKIARNEFRNLFYSPVAWFLMIVFLVQCSIVFTGLLYPIAHFQDIRIENDPNFRNWGDLNSFTRIFFTDPGALFTHILRNLYLFVPLLTMGLISREINNGTVKLLYSSPVTVRQIVFGKYLAVVLYNLMLLGIMVVFMIVAALVTNSIEYGILASAALGFFLLICAYSAIGLFMSSLSNYQIVSVISTFTIILILTYINGLWQKYDFIRDLTWFLSMLGRTDKMLVGLLTTKDVIYFLVVIFMFVSFTLIKLESGRSSRPWYKNAAAYITVAAIGLAIGYASSRPRFTGYWDTTSTGANTIHPRVQKIIKDLGKDEPLEVTLYVNLMDPGAPRAFPENRNAYLDYLWEKYVRFKPNITFKYKYYYDYEEAIMGPELYRRFPNKSVQQIAEKLADLYEIPLSDFMTPEEMKKELNLRPENLKCVMQLEYKGRKVFLRTFPDTEFWPNEMNVAAALKYLVRKEAPKVVFITGNLERSAFKSGEREYGGNTAEKGNRNSLINLGFTIDSVSLESNDIPKDAAMVVLADPKVELSPVVTTKIKDYINGGGNMFILGEPKKQGVLNPVLKSLGVALMPGNIVQLSKNEMPNMVIPYLTDAGNELSDDNLLHKVRRMREQKKNDPGLEFFGADTAAVLMPGVTGISYVSDSAFKIAPLTVTWDRTWLKMGPLVVDSVPPVFNPAEGDVKGGFPTSIQLTRQINGKEQRIIVCGDADFGSNLRSYQSYFSISAFSWLNENDYPVYTPVSPFTDNLLLIGGKVAATIKIIFVWVLPAILLLIGTVLLIRRKRK